MRRPTSLSLRLTLLFSAAAAVVLLTFGWTIGRSIEHHFSEEDASELHDISGSVAQLLTAPRPEPLKQRFEDLLVGHHSALLHVSDENGEVLYASPGPDFSKLPDSFPRNEAQPWREGEHDYLLLLRHSGGYTIITAVATDFHLHFLHEFRRTLWLMVICAIMAMGMMGWIAVRQGHRPLHRVTGQIGQIGASALNSRIATENLPVELTGLAHSFNGLLQRLEESFARLSNFSADIAHELRTPVTNLMTQTQVALAQPRSVAEYQEILYSSMEEYERLAQMIGDMLFLAQADNGLTPPTMAEVDLEQEVRSLFDYYEAWAEERAVTLSVTGTARTQGDRLMLRRALSNLLANAIRHTPKGSGVVVLLGQESDGVTIAVRNPGIPIPPEHLPRLFDRFYRVDPARQRSGEGAGLGLAIVKSIVEMHRGKVAAKSDESGTEFRIGLPRAP